MHETTLTASAQYCDFEGTAAADRTHDLDITTLAKTSGVDTDKYFIIGVGLYWHEPLGNYERKPSVSIQVVERAAVGLENADDLKLYALNNGGVLPYTNIELDISVEQLLKAFKRFNVVLKHKALQDVHEFEQVEFVEASALQGGSA